MQPVTIYLPVHRRARSWKPRPQWWTCQVVKPAEFVADDFVPLAVQEIDEERGSVKRFDFDLERVDPEARVVVARPYEIAASKVWPLERVLLGCGWQQCDPPALAP